MGVFFSGTDKDELIENSEYHNFYLSLIVNNRNEMVAKVAFRAKTIRKTDTTILYRNEAGEESSQSISGSAEEVGVYSYDCIIEKPTPVDESFQERFLAVEKAKEKAEKAKKEAAAKAKEISKNIDNPYTGFDVDARWRQSGLFDDGDVYWGSEKKSGGVAVKGNTGKWESGWEDGEMKQTSKKQKQEAKIERSDQRIYSMLTTLISLDVTNTQYLTTILDKLNKDFYGREEKPVDANLYYDMVEDRVMEFYMNSFPEDLNLRQFNGVMQACISILETHEDKYPELIANLTDVINLAIEE